MAKTPDPKARAAGSSVGNDPPGADDQGNNARRRDAQAGADSVADPLGAGDDPTSGSGRAGLDPEQQFMEQDREEYGSQERGTGDKPPIVHGRTRPVENSTSVVAREFSTAPNDVERIPKTRKVRALKLGYYDDKRRRTGDVFLIRQPYQGQVENADGEMVDQEIDEFSDKWMEDVDPSTRERITTGKESLRQQHDAELAARRHGPRSPEGTAAGDE